MNARLTDRPRSRGFLIAGAALFTLCAAPAAAQERDDEDGERPRGRIVTVGPGIQFNPKFPGADELGISPMPVIDIRRPGRPILFEAPDEGWGFGLLGRDSAINFGPAIQLQGKRDEEDVGAPVGNVGFTVEAGAFVQAHLGQSFRLRAEGRRGIGGHEAWLGDLSADFIARDGDRTIFSIGPRLRLADDKYMDAYFGVAPGVGIVAGLPAYDPSGGVYAIGGTTSLRHHFGSDGRWGIHAYARYDRLVGDAADSPIVTGFGSANQFGAGLGLSYTFRVGGRR
jgi:outer membrane scaffolding protein for murein synthesis (MipA/OmpV family)